MEGKEIEQYDKETFDVTDMDNTDIRINPDYYIHHTLMKAQTCLIKEDIGVGFLQFRMIVEHLEVLCRSANIIKDDFKTDIDEYKKTDDYKKADVKISEIRLANKKIELITKEVFKSRLRTDPMSDKA